MVYDVSRCRLRYLLLVKFIYKDDERSSCAMKMSKSKAKKVEAEKPKDLKDSGPLKLEIPKDLKDSGAMKRKRSVVEGSSEVVTSVPITHNVKSSATAPNPTEKDSKKPGVSAGTKPVADGGGPSLPPIVAHSRAPSNKRAVAKFFAKPISEEKESKRQRS